MVDIQFLPYTPLVGSWELRKSSTGILLMNYRILDNTYIQGKCGSESSPERPCLVAIENGLIFFRAKLSTLIIISFRSFSCPKISKVKKFGILISLTPTHKDAHIFGSPQHKRPKGRPETNCPCTRYVRGFVDGFQAVILGGKKTAGSACFRKLCAISPQTFVNNSLSLTDQKLLTFNMVLTTRRSPKTWKMLIWADKRLAPKKKSTLRYAK